MTISSAQFKQEGVWSGNDFWLVKLGWVDFKLVDYVSMNWTKHGCPSMKNPTQEND
jgi:hypothetical protein